MNEGLMHSRLTKKEAYAFTRSAYRYLSKDCEAVFLTKIPGEMSESRKAKKKYLTRVFGLYGEDDEESIKIDYRYDIVPTIIHELLHALHKDWTEKKVRKEERRHLRGLSQRQIINLLKHFLNYV